MYSSNIYQNPSFKVSYVIVNITSIYELLYILGPYLHTVVLPSSVY